MTIFWKGIFERMTEEYRKELQRLLKNFLEEANLVCDGMTVVGYQYEERGNFEKIEIIAHPEHCNHVDLRLGVTHEWRGVHLWDGLCVRVMWNRNGLFPQAMGVPTVKRLRAAVSEFNATGSVQTKVDDLPAVPSYAAGMALGVRAIMDRHGVSRIDGRFVVTGPQRYQ